MGRRDERKEDGNVGGYLFECGGGTQIGKKSVFEQPVEGDLILDAVDSLQKENDSRLVLRRQTCRHRRRRHHLSLAVLAKNLRNGTK